MPAASGCIGSPNSATAPSGSTVPRRQVGRAQRRPGDLRLATVPVAGHAAAHTADGRDPERFEQRQRGGRATGDAFAEDQQRARGNELTAEADAVLV
jgi:hypothetical protein